MDEDQVKESLKLKESRPLEIATRVILGRGLQGRGRGSIKGPIRDAKGISGRSKLPFATPGFNELRVADSLSRQRSRLLRRAFLEAQPLWDFCG